MADGRELGLGSLAWMSLAEAREGGAESCGQRPGRGRDPDLLRQTRGAELRGGREASSRLALRTLKSDRHAELWLRSLELYAFPKIGQRPIQSITSADVLSILNPIWAKKHDTARRVKQRIAAGLRLGERGGALSAREPRGGAEEGAARREAEGRAHGGDALARVARFHGAACGARGGLGSGVSSS